MARITEEAVKALTQSGELSTVDVHMKEKLEQMRKEREVIGLEIKQLTSKNDDMKNAFAILLDKFQMANYGKSLADIGNSRQAVIDFVIGLL